MAGLEVASHALHRWIVCILLFAKWTLPPRRVGLFDMDFPFISCAEKELRCRTVFGDAGVGAQVVDDMLPSKRVVSIDCKGFDRKSEGTFLPPYFGVVEGFGGQRLTAAGTFRNLSTSRGGRSSWELGIGGAESNLRLRWPWCISLGGR